MRAAHPRDTDALVWHLIMLAGAHVDRKSMRRLVERMLNVSRRQPDSHALLVAESEDGVRGFVYASRTGLYELYDDKVGWYVHYIVGKAVLRSLLAGLRRRTNGDPVYFLVWDDYPRSRALVRTLRGMGLTGAGTALVMEG